MMATNTYFAILYSILFVFVWHMPNDSDELVRETGKSIKETERERARVYVCVCEFHWD